MYLLGNQGRVLLTQNEPRLWDKLQAMVLLAIDPVTAAGRFIKTYHPRIAVGQH